MSIRFDPQFWVSRNKPVKRAETDRSGGAGPGDGAAGQQVRRSQGNGGRDTLAAHRRLGPETDLATKMTGLVQGTSLLASATGGLEQMAGHLHRMRELALGAAGDSLDGRQRRELQAEFAGVRARIDRTSAETRHGDRYLLDGTAGMVDLGTGPGRSDLRLTLDRNFDAASLGLSAVRIDGGDALNARLAVEEIDRALGIVGRYRAEMEKVGEGVLRAQHRLAVESVRAGNEAADAEVARRIREMAGQTGLQIRDQAAAALQSHSSDLMSLAAGLLD